MSSSENLEINRFKLFTVLINEINLLLADDEHFGEKIAQVLRLSASFLNVQAAYILLDLDEKRLFECFGLPEEAETLLQNCKLEKNPPEITLKPMVDAHHAPIEFEFETTGFIGCYNKETAQGLAIFDEYDRLFLNIIAGQISGVINLHGLLQTQYELLHFNEIIFNATSSAIVATDMHLNVIKTNVKALEWFGSEKLMVGQSFLNAFSITSPVRSFVREIAFKPKTQAADGLPISAQNPRLLNVYASPFTHKTNLEGQDGLFFSFDDVTEYQMIRQTASRYLHKEVLDNMLSNKHKNRLGGKDIECAVFFCDIRGFTAMSESLAPEEVVESLNQYFNVMLRHVELNDGVVDKLVGDEIMAIFQHKPDRLHPLQRALQTSREMAISLEMLNDLRQTNQQPDLHFGIGIHYGKVVAGNIGSFSRMDYTVIGDTVNSAARLCSAAGKGELLIPESQKEYLEISAEIHESRTLTLKGKSGKTKVAVIKLY